MKLLPNWRAVLARAWSVRLIVLGAIVQGGALYWSAFEGALDARLFFGIGIVLQLASVISRVVDQQIGGGDDQ